MDYDDGRFGMLTVSISGTLHRVGRILTKDKHLIATILCKELGHTEGYLIYGPWQKLHNGRYSVMKTWCRSSEVRFRTCSRFEILDSAEMNVDYVVCETKKCKIIVITSKSKNVPVLCRREIFLSRFTTKNLVLGGRFLA